MFNRYSGAIVANESPKPTSAEANKTDAENVRDT
jgi:hypothetical protein